MFKNISYFIICSWSRFVELQICWVESPLLRHSAT